MPSRPSSSSSEGFTLIELLVVIAIIAILAVVVVLTLNPAQLLEQSRDADRLSSLSTMNTAISLAAENGVSLGTPNTVYVSIPDPTLTGNQTSTCPSMGLPSLPTGWNYYCVSAQDLHNADGTGWMPINFKTIPSGSPIGSLPTDAVNQTSTNLFMAYATDGTNYEVTDKDESSKDAPNQCSDGGEYSDIQESGTNTHLIPADMGGGEILVGDGGNLRVVEFSSSGSYLGSFGSAGSGNGQFQRGFSADPMNIAIDSSGNIYVTDAYNDRVEKFDCMGNYLSQFSSSHLLWPEGIAIDATGNLWIVDNDNTDVDEFSSSGIYEGQFGSSGSSPGEFQSPTDIAIDQKGNIWVSDQSNRDVQEFNASGTYEGEVGSYGSGNGEFYQAEGVAIDASGNIWAGDLSNQRLEEFNASDTYEFHIGPVGGTINPQGVALDAGGKNIYVANINGNVMEFSTNSTGTYEVQFGLSGAGALMYPVGITVQK